MRHPRAALSLIGVVPLAALAMTTGVLPAQAATSTPVAGLAISPGSVTAGSPATVTVTAKNTGRKSLGQVALGVSGALAFGSPVPPAGATCRPANVSGTRLYYCLLTSLPAGKTATLTVTVTPLATGKYVLNSYAREIATMTETTATATLTAT